VVGDVVHRDGVQPSRVPLAELPRHVRVDDGRRQVNAVDLALRPPGIHERGLGDVPQRHERLPELQAVLQLVGEGRVELLLGDRTDLSEVRSDRDVIGLPHGVGLTHGKYEDSGPGWDPGGEGIGLA